MASSTKLWQYPHVNVVKYAQSEESIGIKKRGNVQELIDRTHGKPVFVIRGPVSANNYIAIPSDSMKRSLNLRGRYLYIQMLVPERHATHAASNRVETKEINAEKRSCHALAIPSIRPLDYFVFHLDIITQDDLTIRISLGNLFDSVKVQFKSVSVPIGEHIRGGRWTVFVVDVARVVSDLCQRTYRFLRSVTFCSNITLRNLYTSDILYDQTTLARDMFLPVPKGSQWSDLYDWCWYPERPVKQLAERKFHSPKEALPAVPISAPNDHKLPADSVPAYLTVSEKGDCECNHSQQGTSCSSCHNENDGAFHHECKRGSEQYVQSAVEHDIVHEGTQTERRKRHKLQPEPILSCRHIFGYSGKQPNNVVWTRSGQCLLYSNANTILVHDAQTGAQRVLLGHTSRVCAIAVDSEGILMASAQDGPDPLVRVWNLEKGLTVTFLKGHHRDMTSLDISANGNMLVAVGMDQSARHKLVVWDISKILDTGRAELVVSKSTVFHVHRIRFVPFEDTRMVSCGKDNIRFWRVYKGLLRDVSVDTSADDRNDLMRQNFLDFSFERAFLGTTAPDCHRIFVSTQSGAVYEISLQKRIIEYVFQLHGAAIHTIDVNEGMCVTGSDDKFMRVWPLDFSDYFLEAEYDSAVRSVELSGDGLCVAVGTVGGSIGLLDLTSQSFRTIVRSHTGRVIALALDPRQRHFCTASPDHTIRIWDIDTREQLFQFDTVGEYPVCVAYHPDEPWVVCGFDSGVVRLFDVETATVLQEYRAHRTAVRQLLYAAGGRWLVSASSESLCVVDCAHGYQPVRVLHYVTKCDSVSVALSPDGNLLASVGPAKNVVHLFSTDDFSERFILETGSSEGFVSVCFSSDSKELVAITSDARIMRMDINCRRVVSELTNSNCIEMTCLAVSCDGRFAVTGARDCSLRVWDLSLRSLQGMQSFSGHFGNVNQVLFSDDMGVVLSAGDDGVILWDFLGNKHAGCVVSDAGSDDNSQDKDRDADKVHKEEGQLVIVEEGEEEDEDAVQHQEQQVQVFVNEDERVQDAGTELP